MNMVVRLSSRCHFNHNKWQRSNTLRINAHYMATHNAIFQSNLDGTCQYGYLVAEHV
jgi:hypothetical protein